METIGELRIWLLGGFRVEHDGRPVRDDAWRRNRARALVKLLALEPDHRLHREQLIDILWPELEVDAGSASLRKAAYFARQAMGAQNLRTHGDLVELEARPLWVDVTAFEVAVRAGRSEEAVALYRGDLLPEDRYEAWTEGVRERLRLQYQRVLLELSADYERDGDLVAAIDALERLVSSDPLHEEAQLRLMRLHALSGARHLAVRRFHQLESNLRKELDVAPATAVQDLYQEILDGRFPPAVTRTPSLVVPAGDVDRTKDTGKEQRKLVTALWTEALLPPADPEVTREELASWTEKTAAVIESWGSTAETQAGGTVVAVFGVPRVHEDDMARALLAALEIRDTSVLPVRSGVSTGEVIVPGGDRAFARTAAGAVLVSAGRLREMAEPGAVLVAERTCLAVRRQFRFSPTMSLGAGPDPLRASTVVAVEDNPASEPDAPLVGRESELAGVADRFDNGVEDGRPRLVLLVGSAGVGKSRLVREIAATVTQRHPGTRVLRGRCLSADRGAVYWALGEVLREACGIWLSESADTVQRRLRKSIQELLPGLEPAEQEATIFALATTAGIALRDNPLDRLQPDEVAERLGLAWPQFITACAAAAPTLIVLEDLHWATPELVQMVELIVARSVGPLMLLATARPEYPETHPTFGAASGDTSVIALAPLSRGQSQQLLQSLVTGNQLAADLYQEVLTRAEGNPLYLEQLTLHVRTAGSAVLPDSLHSLLAARLDALPPPERHLLQEAAVVGRTFWEEPLRQALPGEPLSARLATLERKGFVIRRPTSSLSGQSELSFRHALLHDAAYESLPRARRARAHAAVGTWLEELAGERLDEVADLLAHHFWLASDLKSAGPAWRDEAESKSVRQKAQGYLVRAGVAARQRFATERALELHNRALELAASTHERILALEALAEDHQSAFHGDESVPSYREAIDLSSAEPGEAATHSRLCRELAWEMVWNPGAFASSPDPAEVDALVEAGLRTVDDDAERAWLLLVHAASARLYRGSEPFGQGSRADIRPIAERIDAAEQAVATGKTLGRADLVNLGENALAMLYGIAGRFGDVLTLDQRGVNALGIQSTRLEQSDALRKLGYDLVSISADFENGLSYARRGYELAREFGPHGLMHNTFPVMAALFHLGRWDELLPFVHEHVRAFRMQPALECQFVRDGPVLGALTLSLLGRTDEASELALLVGEPLSHSDRASAWEARYATISGHPEIARTLSWDKALERRTYGPQHALVVVEALLALEDWAQLLAFLPQARIAVDGNALLAPVADRAEGLMLLARGDRSAAADLIQRSLHQFRELRTPWEEARTLEALGRVLPDAEAHTARGIALAIYEQLGVGRRTPRPSGRAVDPS